MGLAYAAAFSQPGRCSSGKKAPEKNSRGKRTRFITRWNPCIVRMRAATTWGKPLGGGEEDGHGDSPGDEERRVVAVADEGRVQPLGYAGAQDRQQHQGEQHRGVELGARPQDGADVPLEEGRAGGGGAHRAASPSAREAPTMSK